MKYFEACRRLLRLEGGSKFSMPEVLPVPQGHVPCIVHTMHVTNMSVRKEI